MYEAPVKVTRLPHRIHPDPRRVIARFFGGDEARNRRRIQRVLSLPAQQVECILAELTAAYARQHPDIADIWREHFSQAKGFYPEAAENLDEPRRLLIGAYFTMEYSVESAALFNPSIVPALDQSGLPDGSRRFLMSLRATGEGHLSSIVFRRGVIDADGNIEHHEPSPISRMIKPIPDAEFNTGRFRQTLLDVGAHSELVESVLDALGESFSLGELECELAKACDRSAPSDWEAVSENMLTLARSNYKLKVPRGIRSSEIVIFPTSENESRGIEDLRMVHFTHDDGTVKIYGTYTAYNGFTTFPTLMETSDLETIEVHTMAGTYARNKGMALFPRKIKGDYVMSGRLDGENLYILRSKNNRVWNSGELSQEPKYWWEFSIIGNCGSPVETPEGWLLLTHGVGPMRQYCIGAVLLDLDDPSKVIGRTRDPLIVPEDEERVGYVPNVVYTCGMMAHNGKLIIPFAVSDHATTFASIKTAELIDYLKTAS